MYNMPMRLSRILDPIRLLRWKLTLSYTLATVAAVLVLEVVALCALLLLFSAPAVQIDLAQDAAAALAEEVQPLLSATPPDQEGLQFWLRQMVPAQSSSRSAPDIDLDSDTCPGPLFELPHLCNLFDNMPTQMLLHQKQKHITLGL